MRDVQIIITFLGFDHEGGKGIDLVRNVLLKVLIYQSGEDRVDICNVCKNRYARLAFFKQTRTAPSALILWVSPRSACGGVFFKEKGRIYCPFVRIC